MKSILTVLLCAATIIFAAVALFVRPDINESMSLSDEADAAGISYIDMEIINEDVNVNVHLRKNLTCREIIQIIKLGELGVGNLTYIPTCHKVNNRLARIIFSKSIII